MLLDILLRHTDRVFPLTEELTEFLTRLRAVHDEFYPDSSYLFPDESQKNKVINNHVVYRLYVRMCRNLGIEISREYTKGPQSASRHYYTGIDVNQARNNLEQDKVTRG